MNLSRYIIAVAMATLAIGAFAAETAASVLNGMRAQLTSSAAVEAKFTINGGNGPVEGSIEMSGARFALSTPQLRVWYDGKTQWTMLDKTKEVSISEPTAEELTAANPFSILRDYAATYQSRLLPALNGLRRVELTPRGNDSGISRIVICADKKNMPAALTIFFEDGQQIVVNIDNIHGRSALPDKAFRYDSHLYPASETIDLR